MININDVLRELNILSFKKYQNSIKKLMNIIKTDHTVTKLFIIKNIFIFLILSTILVSVILNKILKFFVETFEIMQLNNIKIVIVNNI